MKRTIGTVLVLGAVIPFAACGGGAGSEETDKLDKALTHAEFVKTLNGICQDNDDDTEFDREYQRAVDRGDYDAAADLMEKAVPRVNEYIGNLRDVDPPVYDKAAYGRFVDGIEALGHAIPDLAEVLRDTDDFGQMLVVGERVDEATKKYSGAAREMGATECVES